MIVQARFALQDIFCQLRAWCSLLEKSEDKEEQGNKCPEKRWSNQAFIEKIVIKKNDEENASDIHNYVCLLIDKKVHFPDDFAFAN